MWLLHGEEVWKSEDFAFSKPEASVAAKYLMAFSDLANLWNEALKYSIFQYQAEKTDRIYWRTFFFKIWSLAVGGDKVVEKN